MRQVLLAVWLSIFLGITLAVKVRIENKAVEYIASKYNSKLEPLEYEYDAKLAERIAIDKRGFVYVTGFEMLTVFKLLKNGQLKLVHTESFENFTFESIQTCKGVVTAVARHDVDGDGDTLGENDEGRLFVFRAFNKRMMGNLQIIHSIPLPIGPEFHVITRNCRKVIVALEENSTIGIVNFDSIFGTPTVSILGFGSFESMKEALEADWFLFQPGVPFDENFDPEWVCLNKKETTAYVNLKDNNGVAKIDLTAGPGQEQIVQLISYGIKNWALTPGFDSSETPMEAKLRVLPIFALHNPEQIACITIKKRECILLAGEGLAAGEPNFMTDLKDTAIEDFFPDNIRDITIAGDLHVLQPNTQTDPDGNGNLNLIVTSGSRSFDLLCGDDLDHKAGTESDIELQTMNSVVYNSEILANQTLAERFDKESDGVGPEPEAVIAKHICGGRYVLLVGISEDTGYLWAFTLDTWNIRAGFKFQDKMHGFQRIDSFLTDHELYEERQTFLRNAEGLRFVPGRGPKGKVRIVVGSKITSTLEVYDLNIQCRARRRHRPRHKH